MKLAPLTMGRRRRRPLAPHQFIGFTRANGAMSAASGAYAQWDACPNVSGKNWNLP